MQVVVVLEVEPELRCGAECLAQPQRGIGSDTGRPQRDALDARARDIHLPGQRASRQFEQHQELLAQNFSRMHGCEFLDHR